MAFEDQFLRSFLPQISANPDRYEQEALNMGAGDQFLNALTFGGHGRARVAEGRAKDEAAAKQKAILQSVNTNVWDAPTQQQQLLEAMASNYNQGVASGQAQLSRMLMNQAQGKGPSIAQMQLRAGADDNLRNSLAMQGAARGAGAQGAQRLAALQQSSIGNQMNQNAALLRLQEQRGAQAQLAGLYGQMGSQNVANAGLQNQIMSGAQDRQIDRERFLAGLRMGDANWARSVYGDAREDARQAKQDAMGVLKAGGDVAASLAGI